MRSFGRLVLIRPEVGARAGNWLGTCIATRAAAAPAGGVIAS